MKEQGIKYIYCCSRHNEVQFVNKLCLSLLSKLTIQGTRSWTCELAKL